MEEICRGSPEMVAGNILRILYRYVGKAAQIDDASAEDAEDT
jgi:hypothetical protein